MNTWLLKVASEERLRQQVDFWKMRRTGTVSAARATAQGFGRFAELDAAVKTVKLLRTSFGLEFEPKQFAVDFRDVPLVDRKMTPKRAKYHNYRD